MRSGLARACDSRARLAGFFGAAVIVGEPLDIVLAEIGAELHFDHAQRLRAWILQPVDFARRNVDITARSEAHLALSYRHQRLAAGDDPLLGALAVPLQRKLCAGPHEDFLHLEPGVDRERAEPAPRA